MVNRSIVIKLLVALAGSQQILCGASKVPRSSIERMDEFMEIYTRKSFLDNEADLREIANHNYPDRHDHWPPYYWQINCTIMKDSVLAWESSTRRQFDKLNPREIKIDNVFSKSSLSKLNNEDQQCVADLYSRSIHVDDYEDQCDAEVWWRMYGKFAKCLSTNLKNTQFGAEIIQQIVAHIDLCKKNEWVLHEYELPMLKRMILANKSGSGKLDRIYDYWYVSESDNEDSGDEDNNNEINGDHEYSSDGDKRSGNQKFNPKVIENYSDGSVEKSTKNTLTAAEVKSEINFYLSGRKYEAPVDDLEIKNRGWGPSFLRSFFGRSCK